MGLVRTEGVILRTYPFSETSKIVHAYTLHYGLQSLMAKGARRSRSKFGGSLETFTRLELLYYKKKTDSLNTLSECSVLESFPGLSIDLDRFYAGSVCIDMVKRFTMPEENNVTLYRLIISSLRKIECSKPDDSERHLLSFIWQFLTLMGFRPDFMICASCGGAMEDPSVLIAYDEAVGGFCGSCSANHPDTYIVDKRAGEFIQGISEGKDPNQKQLDGDFLLDVWRFTINYIRLHLHQDKGIASLGSFLRHVYTMKVS